MCKKLVALFILIFIKSVGANDRNVAVGNNRNGICNIAGRCCRAVVVGTTQCFDRTAAFLSSESFKRTAYGVGGAAIGALVTYGFREICEPCICTGIPCTPIEC